MNVASMFFFSNLLHCRCKDASPKGGYRRATPMLQIFHVCDDNPQRHRILLHSRNHHKDQLEQKMGKSWWHFVVSWTMVQSYKVKNCYNKILLKVVARERRERCCIQRRKNGSFNVWVGAWSDEPLSKMTAI